MRPPLHLATLLVAAVAAAASATSSAAESRTLKCPLVLSASRPESGVQLALADLARDLHAVLGGDVAVATGAEGDILVRIDPALAEPESYAITVADDGVTIIGADELGAIYGIYRFSRQFLGIDPYWFWKDAEPRRQKAITLVPQTIRSAPAAFRYRGWFLNDEDLLTEWKEGGGRRSIDYPFYAQVIHPEVADRVFETLLRAGGNLVIPASFVDVMNPPEAELARHAARRGLYVTQHHIEALGVSHFGFESYWSRRGEKVRFSYGNDPERVRQTWRDYARRWRELCGDHVVWQLGLRGRGDAPIWAHDPGVAKDAAGAFISRALADQWEIVREVDPRPQPPATTTLWMEGSELMSRGALQIPSGVAVVFADRGESQTMQDDFHHTPRVEDRTYGVYYHIAFWSRGPHLVQGTRPEKLQRVFHEIVAKGDTHYAMLNVCNLREHVLGVQAATELMVAPAEFDADRCLQAFAPPVLQPFYRDLLASFVQLEGEQTLQDGTVGVFAGRLRKAIREGKRDTAAILAGLGVPAGRDLAADLDAAVARLDRIVDEYPADRLTEAQRRFYDVHLLLQAQVLRGLYRHLAALVRAVDDPRRLADAEAALAEVLEVRRVAEQGGWADWYRGDKKMNLPYWLEKTRALRAR